MSDSAFANGIDRCGILDLPVVSECEKEEEKKGSLAFLAGDDGETPLHLVHLVVLTVVYTKLYRTSRSNSESLQRVAKKSSEMIEIR